MKRFFFLICLVLFLSGCATLRDVAKEAGEITREETTEYTLALKTLLSPFTPYAMPAAAGLGYVLALLRRLYKKKKGSKN